MNVELAEIVSGNCRAMSVASQVPIHLCQYFERGLSRCLQQPFVRPS